MGEWVARADLDRTARVRLFCLPHAGAGAAGFQRWRRILPVWVAVCPVLLPGREGRIREAAIDSLDELVRGLSDAIGPRLRELPYAVFGHSMGALLGFAWLRRIEEAKGPQALRLFCSGRESPGHRGAEPLAGLEDEPLLTGLVARYGAQARALLDDPEMQALFLPVLRADLSAVEQFRAEAGARVSCGVSAFAGADDPAVTQAGLLGWKAVSGPGFRAERFPGGHFYPFAEGQASLLARIEAELVEATVEVARGGAWEDRD